MRSTLSLVTLFSLIVVSFSPAFGQRKRVLPVKDKIERIERSDKIDRAEPTADRSSFPTIRREKRNIFQKTDARFEVVEGFSEGKGVWVRWRMDLERRNAGFTVYALTPNGEVAVSNFITGSSFSHGEQDLRGGEYYFYHPEGSLNQMYRVEAVGDDGRLVRAGYIVPSYVNAIEDISGGAEMKADTFAAKPGARIAKEDLLVSYDLQAEIQSGMIVPDPVKHREVISQPGARIASKADGLIRVSKTELQNSGFNVNSDPTNWQIFLQGVELPMIIGPNADYIEFFGKSLDTRESDIRTYYLISGASAGRRITNRVARKSIASIVSRKYDQTFTRQDKKNYTNQVLNGSAENWWGDVVASGYFNYNFDLSAVDRTPGTRKMTISFQGFSITPHVVELTLNGTALPDVSGSGRFPFSGTIDVPVELLLDGQNTLRMRSVGMGFNPDGTPKGGDLSFIGKLSIDFPRKYEAMSDKLEFYTDNYKNARVSGFSTPNIRIFDFTHESDPRLLTNVPIVQTNSTWGPLMPAARERLLYAVADGVYGSALSVTPNDPALLSDPGHAGTMVLISHPSFLTQANAWAGYRSGQGISTKVVDVTDIYDEFSYGVLSSQAIEDFLNYAKNNWQTPPSYAMLFGEAHYDSRNYGGAGYWNMVPARLVDTLYTETGSDEALSDFNDDGLAEIPIGRAASRDGAGITALFDKTVAWEAALTANSLNRGVLFAFDGPDGYDFEAMSNRMKQPFVDAGLPNTNVRRCDGIPPNCVQPPDRQQMIVDSINDLDGGTQQAPGANAGQYLVNYAGHGSSSAWQNSNFFSTCNLLGTGCSPQRPQLTNTTYPTMMIALTCLNGYFMGNIETFAEVMTKSSGGGAVAVWASTGLTTPDVQEIMGARFYSKVVQGTIPRMGDLIADAKAQVPAGADVRLSWALLGDPMLKVR